MDKFLLQIGHALSSIWGWIILIITMLLTFIEPEKMSFIVVGLAVFADLFWGIVAAVKLDKFILSKALRETIKKIGVYSFALVMVFVIEKIAHGDGIFIGVRTIAILASVCELWSMSASMLIVKPDMPFLKLFRAQLKGEIESKVGKNVNLDEILKEKAT